MPILSTTCDWFILRPGITYRKSELYTMQWAADTELYQMQVVAAPYGGPMAIVRDSKEFIKVGGSTKPIIRIFTASGHLLSTINWNSGNLLTLGWSDAEELLCVQDDGLVLIYNMYGVYQHTFSMGQEAKDTKVIDAKIFASNSGTGVAVMTTNYRIFLINSIKEPKNRQLPEMPKSILDPTCWAIINEDRNTCTLVAREHELFKLSQGYSVCSVQAVSIENEFKSITVMSVSYNHRFLALYTNNGIVWMGTSDLQTKYCEFKTNQSEKPKQIEWILDSENYSQAEAIVIAYSSLLLVVTVAGDSNMYSYDSVPFLIPEMDCVRILSNTEHEMLQKVPNCVNNIFKINSQKPSSYLFGAYQKYEEKSHQSDEYLGLIKNKLEESVNECIEAAGFEFDANTQKSLIRAAYFGKAFIAGHNPDKYIETCRVLRVLNALRDPKIGVPLTYAQFNRLKPHVVLDRLVFRKFYGLAIQIAKHLKLPESRILEHWAFNKVTYDKNDDDVARKISEKLKMAGAQGISFCNIAKKAQELGRKNLAIRLLEMESKCSLQVPLLLKLGESKRALMSATKSGDTDLIYTVLLQLKETTQLADFQMIVRTFPTAQNLYKKYCNLNSKSALQEIFNQEDDFVAQAEFALREGIANSNIESSLLTASVAYKKAHKDVEAELCEDSRKLLKDQKTFADKYTLPRSQTFYGSSIHETIKRLLVLGDLKNAEKKKTEYKVPDKRFWWLRIQVLSESFQWDELEKFSKAKKSPIGYEPFVEVCLKQNNVEEAKKYLPKCRNDKKIKWYIRAGLAEEAALASFEQRDLHSLYTVHMNATKNNDRALVAKVENYIEKLSEKR
ncbi:vacuolar protein sorting-associated protein 16 homolog [Sitodiplosis mosellana]|uniref:vacuolar protein sorting-associated protein 16 homolog n=1 Tax=Sitodiplosis mosellana TaxID=263140 RepID=UPI002444534F|nr:vacuolar protein sorting-associated protein 16 homolog [Sitodiplosis mosellana]XP_055324769.1 vacuolar protein sorting-associated protein 16 homolog [Sitodiplosis mosellana]